MYAARRRQPGAPRKALGIDLPPIDKPNARARRGSASSSATRLAFKSTATYRRAAALQAGVALWLEPSSLILDPLTALPSSENSASTPRTICRARDHKSVLSGSTFSRVTYDMPGSYQRFARGAPIATPKTRRQRDRGNINTRSRPISPRGPDSAGLVRGVPE